MRFNKIERKNKERYLEFKELYFQAFPKNERRTMFTLWLSNLLGKIDVLSVEEDDNFIGLIITAKHKDLVWVDYLAIAEDYRGQGYGSRILSNLKYYYHDRRIFLEVETPLEDVDNYHQRLKRIAFYKQNGFKASNLRINVYDCDFTILSYNGKIKFQEYLNISKATYGRLDAIIGHIEKLDHAIS